MKVDRSRLIFASRGDASTFPSIAEVYAFFVIGLMYGLYHKSELMAEVIA